MNGNGNIQINSKNLRTDFLMRGGKNIKIIKGYLFITTLHRHRDIAKNQVEKEHGGCGMTCRETANI